MIDKITASQGFFVLFKAVSFLPEGIYGVDLMETKDGFTVHEINHTTEFKNSITTTGVDIPGKMIDYMLLRAKK